MAELIKPFAPVHKTWLLVTIDEAFKAFAVRLAPVKTLERVKEFVLILLITREPEGFTIDVELMVKFVSVGAEIVFAT